MNTPIKALRALSAVLAPVFALAVVGCGSNPADQPNGPGPDTDRPAAVALPEPAAQLNLFDPKTEDELKGLIQNGEFTGRPASNYGYLIARTKPGFNPAAFEKLGLNVVGAMSASGSRYWYLQKDADLVETMKKVRKLAGVAYVEPDVMYYTTAGFAYDAPDTQVANNVQYGVLTTMTKKAWEEYGFGPNRPVVADIDTGIRWLHEDFTRDDGSNVVKHAFSWYGPTLSAGLFDPIFNYPLDAAMVDSQPADRMVTNAATGSTDLYNGHGTHTAGTIAAVGNNGKGVAGVCWNVDLVSYKGLPDSGGGGSWAVYGSLWHLAKWKNELVDANGDPSPAGTPRYPHTIPVNMSLGSGLLTQFNVDMIEMALEHDIVMVCSSGNDYSGFAAFPGSVAGTIRVGATDFLDRRVFFSNWGDDLSVVAPGQRIISTGRASATAYVVNAGTSMSCPHVTGLVGYMLTFAPDLKADQIKTYLERNADPIEGQTGFSPRTGWGRINTYRTISAVIADQNAGRAPDSNYVNTPVKVTVKTADGRAVDGAYVWLYNCDQAGTIENYASAALTGHSFVGVRDNPDLPPEPGVAWFNLLRPGYYKVVSSLPLADIENGGTVTVAASSPMFVVSKGATVPPMTLTMDADLLFVQTLPTAASVAGDTRIVIYNSVDPGAAPVLDYDDQQYDTLLVKRPKNPGPFWVRIYPYNGTPYNNTDWEYALWLGDTAIASAPGSYANPGANGEAGSTTQTRSAASQEIEANGKVVYGRFNASNRAAGDYYMFRVQ